MIKQLSGAIFCGLLILLATTLFSQNTTFTPEEKIKINPGTLPPEQMESTKILVIPFEPKLYMSEIDQNVNKETKLNANQIRESFRLGLDFSVVAAFRKKYKVMSLMSDSAHLITDQHYVYESIAYKYEPLTHTDEKQASKNADEKPKIKDGQIVGPTSSQKKYMNTKITNPKLLPTLHKKYGADLFIFLNELDIKNNVDNTGMASSGHFNRVAGVHYSIYNLEGKLLDSGLATNSFPSSLNDPNKIVNDYFSNIAETILSNFTASITPKTEKKRGALQWQEGK